MVLRTELNKVREGGKTMLARFGVFEWSMVAVVVLGIAAEL
jgi:hypothetical protein